MDGVSLIQAAMLCLVTGGVSSVVTIAAIKVDLANLRAWVTRLDVVASKASEQSSINNARITNLERGAFKA